LKFTIDVGKDKKRSFLELTLISQEKKIEFDMCRKPVVGNSEGKRPLERPMRRWEDGIKMDLREIGLGCVAWICLAQVRDHWRALVNVVMNLWVLVPQN
jgi:hypothetical protein